MKLSSIDLVFPDKIHFNILRATSVERSTLAFGIYLCPLYPLSHLINISSVHNTQQFSDTNQNSVCI